VPELFVLMMEEIYKILTMSVTVECPIKSVHSLKSLLENIVSNTGHRKSESVFPTFHHSTEFRPACKLPIQCLRALILTHVNIHMRWIEQTSCVKNEYFSCHAVKATLVWFCLFSQYKHIKRVNSLFGTCTYQGS
jgi:hypothetical protein